MTFYITELSMESLLEKLKTDDIFGRIASEKEYCFLINRMCHIMVETMTIELKHIPVLGKMKCMELLLLHHGLAENYVI